ncbi:MAG: zf-HC2 domain-containing protein [Planctomycetes bacterium]|nr:zf-HC2 domain-containing protein [Planctomycetota bacterium]MCH9725754.1 zf-HC2 domain-containing protein [Planctomycetota bacterium]MCH9777809.1 zf-HC2 domain-containing protein [Planctomycetota bacterium]MDF1745460.1 zf-HC2 domain-containing protein [Gimesia sp.]
MNKNNPSEHQDPSEAEWQACTPGDLGRFVSVMKKRKQISYLISAAEIATVCLVVGGIGFFGLNQLSNSSTTPQENITEQHQHRPGGLYCSEVLALAKDYVANLLDQKTTQKVEAHLADCPSCQKKVDQLQANRHNNAAELKTALQKQADWESYVLALNQ